MSEVSRILSQIDAGDPMAASQLLPLVYDELRKMAASQLAREQPGQTLQATALVHEAWFRLAGNEQNEPSWDNRAHFFAAAAEALRRILVESARRRKRLKRGGAHVREYLAMEDIEDTEPREDLVALDAALTKLSKTDPEASQLIQLRYFTGLTISEAAEILKISRRTADRRWAYARAWLHRELLDADQQGA